MSEEQKDSTAPATSEAPKPAEEHKVIPGSIRYTALLLSCFFAFGGYLVFDLCSALKDQMTAEFHLSDTQYSLFYVVYAWTNCLMVLFAGALIDNTTNRGCALIFTTIAMLGQTVLSFGVQFRMFWLMVAGRVVFGMGLGSICVAQNTISNTYFKGADLATAFAATLTVSRIGSVLNFFLSTYIYTWFGSRLSYVFWWGTAMTAVSVVCAIIFFFLDRSVEHRGLVVSAKRKSRKIKFNDILQFPALYWVLCIVCSLYYICIFALMAVIVSYLTVRDRPLDGTSSSAFSSLFSSSSSGNEADSLSSSLSSFSSSSSSGGGAFDHKYSILSSLIYLVAIPCVPIFGRIVDYFGKRTVLLLVSVSIMVPFNAYLEWTKWTPIPALIIAGMSYSMVASCLWPSICMTVRDEVVGSANGIATSIQMIGIGLSNLLVGFLKDRFSYDAVMYYFIGCSSLATVFAIIADILNRTKLNGYLNTFSPIKEKARKDAEAKKAAAAHGGDERAPLLVNADTTKQ